MRRPLAWAAATAISVAVAVAVPALACSDDDPTPGALEPTTTVAEDNDGVSAELGAFLDRVATDGTAFAGEYRVLRKIGSVESEVSVTSAPPALRLTVGDLVVVDGPRPATCRVRAERCIGEVREQQLATVGVFSRFWSSGPAEALRALARRDDDEPPVFSQRTIAGVEVDCVAIPVGRALPNLSCITAEGVFGLVDNPSTRFELTAYTPGPPPGPVEPPFTLTADDSFLAL